MFGTPIAVDVELLAAGESVVRHVVVEMAFYPKGGDGDVWGKGCSCFCVGLKDVVVFVG